MRPEQTPIGLELARSARVVARAFDTALSDAGGSLPVWLVVLNLKINSDANQRELADAVGVSGATLTHHLNAMEKDGLLVRRRDPDNRRNHIIELTAEGNATFTRLAATAIAFDQQLRTDLDPAELDTLRTLLQRLCVNVAPASDAPPWAGLVEAAGNRSPKDGDPARDPESDQS